MPHSFSKGANPPTIHPWKPSQPPHSPEHLSIIVSNTLTILTKVPSLKLCCFHHFPGLENPIPYLHRHSQAPQTLPSCPHTEEHCLPSMRAAMCWLFWEGSSLTISRAVRPLLSFMFTSIPMVVGKEQAEIKNIFKTCPNSFLIKSQLTHVTITVWR